MQKIPNEWNIIKYLCTDVWKVKVIFNYFI